MSFNQIFLFIELSNKLFPTNITSVCEKIKIFISFCSFIDIKSFSKWRAAITTLTLLLYFDTCVALRALILWKWGTFTFTCWYWSHTSKAIRYLWLHLTTGEKSKSITVEATSDWWTISRLFFAVTWTVNKLIRLNKTKRAWILATTANMRRFHASRRTVYRHYWRLICILSDSQVILNERC